MAEPTSTDAPVLSAVPSTVVSAVGTPASLPPMDSDEREKSIKVSLADLTAKATALYAQKNYEEAAEVYANAAEMQAELNGEMAPENADILYLYGRSLFKVGQSKSDVLGAPAGGEKKKSRANGANKPKKARGESSATAALEEKPEADKIAEEGVAIIAKNADGSAVKDEDEVPEAKKPLFQFTGDENFEDSDEEEDGDGEGEGDDDDEEDDDLAVAFEVLDLSRVLFEKALEQSDAQVTDGKGKETAQPDAPSIRHVKERLADTHDLLAEISLENEKYPLAINDARASLRYKIDLYPEESEIRAEAHFKLSLALEFASVTTSNEENKEEGPKAVDEEMRAEAAVELENAINSTKLKLQAEEVNLAAIHAPEDNDESRKKIAEGKDIIADMEQRLVDLKKPPMDVEGVLGADNPMSGILGAALGESAAETEARVEEAKKNAKDLSKFVRKKEKKSEEAPPPETNGKRKAEEPAEGSDDSKKAKVEEEAPTAES
ncbi:histone H1-binding protein [Xylariales sp. AK1849]|nr:histone H1-binding protein [Xylariales sp. AK1849]